ncbi:MAG: Ig-like domain-containing protein [Gemmatimonadota bacterium]|nr:Ig-like domain-containing protein [Candidatus Palauibacter scopulicola]
MGVQPATIQADLVPATASTDDVPPTSAFDEPSGPDAESGLMTVSGTASDARGGVVAAVEVSLDGGMTWRPARGRANWSYAWDPDAVGEVSIMSRAVDDSGNLETPGESVAAAGGGG